MITEDEEQQTIYEIKPENEVKCMLYYAKTAFALSHSGGQDIIIMFSLQANGSLV